MDKFIPDNMVDDLCISDTPENAIEKLQKFRDIGIDLPILQFNPIGETKKSFELLTKTFSGDIR